MTVHFVTTGMSLRERSRCWQHGAFAAANLDNTPSDRLTSEDLKEFERVRDGVFQELRADDVWGSAKTVCETYFREAAWDPKRGYLLSAELNTLAKMASQSLIVPGDRIHVFHGAGRNPVGGSTNVEVCALLEAILERQTVAGRPLFGVSVERSGPYEWDPLNTRAFDEGVKTLWARVSAVGAEAPISLVLTGGYKAVLIDLARRVGYFSLSSTLHYVFEDSDAELVSMQTQAGPDALFSTRTV